MPGAFVFRTAIHNAVELVVLLVVLMAVDVPVSVAIEILVILGAVGAQGSPSYRKLLTFLTLFLFHLLVCWTRGVITMRYCATCHPYREYINPGNFSGHKPNCRSVSGVCPYHATAECWLPSQSEVWAKLGMLFMMINRACLASVITCIILFIYRVIKLLTPPLP